MSKFMKISFNEGKYDEIDLRLRMPIPDEFHSNATPSAVHEDLYLFSVPKNWPLELSSTDAPFYFYVELEPFKSHYQFDVAKLDYYKNLYTSFIMNNFFDDDSEIYHTGSDKVNMMYQFYAGDRNDFVRATSIVCVGKLSYPVIFVYSHNDPSVDKNAVFEWFHELLSRWVRNMESINEWKDDLL